MQNPFRCNCLVFGWRNICSIGWIMNSLHLVQFRIHIFSRQSNIFNARPNLFKSVLNTRQKKAFSCSQNNPLLRSVVNYSKWNIAQLCDLKIRLYRHFGLVLVQTAKKKWNPIAVTKICSKQSSFNTGFAVLCFGTFLNKLLLGGIK